MMAKKTVLVTGSCGLIGSEVVKYFDRLGHRIVGIDNNHRAVFFGPEGDTSWTLSGLQSTCSDYQHESIDVRDKTAVFELTKRIRPDLIVHTAAQPSHDRAASIPILDFEVNALGTLHLLEAVRQYCTESPFIHMSTNKVYGDLPNSIPLVESDSRWDFNSKDYLNGIPETFSIDQSKHSVFGASKVAADVMVQEYGRYFGMLTCCLRGGCLTGPNHSGVQLHGFLSYLIKCNLTEKEYTVFGYKGKQVRDNIHSEDVVRFMHRYYENPRSGEVYNLGGGKENSCSMLEAFAMVSNASGIEMKWRYSEEARSGDHICYYSDLTKIKAHYPGWGVIHSLTDVVSQIVESWRRRI